MARQISAAKIKYCAKHSLAQLNAAHKAIRHSDEVSVSPTPYINSVFR